MPKSAFITVAQAAKEKGTSPQNIYELLNRAALTEQRVGSVRLVVTDAKYRAYQVKATGGRAHRSYIEKHIREEAQ